MASFGLISNIHELVDMDEYSISYTSIETRALSSCLYLLLGGIIGTRPFCFLSHVSRHQELEGGNLYYLLIELLDELSKQLNTSLQINSLSSEKTQIKNLKLLIGGGPIGHHVLLRQCFIMLNDNSDSIVNEIKSLTSDENIIYLVHELLNSVIVIPPITYLTTEEHETKGFENQRIFEPPCVLLTYDCQSKKGLMRVEWSSSSSSLFMASIFIKNLFSNDKTQFKWKWEQKNIIQMIKKLQDDEDEDQLNAFIKDANFVLSSIRFDACQDLKTYSSDLIANVQIEQLEPVIGRDEEIYRIIEVLSKTTQNNVLLIGPSGVGKKPIVNGLAQFIINQDIPNALPQRLIRLNINELIDDKNRFNTEKRLNPVLKEIRTLNDEVILFIDEIHLIAQLKDTMDSTKLFKSMLIDGEFRCIGSTTLDEYKTHIEKDPVFEKCFQQVFVKEISIDD